MSQPFILASSSRLLIDGTMDTTGLESVLQHKGQNQQQNDISATQESNNDEDDDDDDVNGDGESCLICLGNIIDQSVLPKCMHSLFCFDCIIKWISIHRRCPLCSTLIEEYIIHSIRNDDDYIRHYLPKLDNQKDQARSDEQVDPLRLQADISQTEARRIRRQLQQRVQSGSHHRHSSSTSTIKPEWGQVRIEERQRDAIADWDHRLAYRKEIYQQEMYCYHIGTNPSSKFTSPLSHLSISSSPLIESTLLSFIRRELLAFPLMLDVDFLSRYTIHVFKSFDFKSNEAMNLMKEFLGYRGAQHFCHELYTFSRFIGQASAKQRDKVKAFDEWAHYRPVKGRRGSNGRRSQVLRVVQEIPTIAIESNEVLADSSFDIPKAVIQGREKPLQRLEEDRSRYRRHSTIADDVHVEKPSIDREKALKDKILLGRREAILRSRAIAGRAKRLKT